MIYVYIIIENVNRELYSRLLIASEILKKKNCVIVIGDKDYLRNNVNRLPPGTIIEKGANYRLEKYFKLYKQNNHLVYILDEESYTFPSIKNYFKLNIDNRIIKYIDGIFAVNKLQKNIIKKKFKTVKIYLTGNPKFEIYKKKYHRIFEKDKINIKNRFKKKIILFTSRFAHINPNKTNLDDIDIVDKLYLKTSKIIFNLFLKLIVNVAKKYKSYQIVYRPHPSENLKKIKEKFKKISNIFVDYSSPIACWILASEIIIHNRCTTGFESILLKKPTISYDPIKYKSMHNKFFYLLGKDCRTQRQVLQNINLALSNKKLIYKKNKKVLNYYCHEIQNNVPERCISKSLFTINCKKKINFFGFFLQNLIENIKKIYTIYFIKEKILENYNYRKQKFGFLNKEKIITNLAYINKIKKKKCNFKIKKLMNNVFIIKNV